MNSSGKMWSTVEKVSAGGSPKCEINELLVRGRISGRKLACAESILDQQLVNPQRAKSHPQFAAN